MAQQKRQSNLYAAEDWQQVYVPDWKSPRLSEMTQYTCQQTVSRKRHTAGSQQTTPCCS